MVVAGHSCIASLVLHLQVDGSIVSKIGNGWLCLVGCWMVHWDWVVPLPDSTSYPGL